MRKTLLLLVPISNKEKTIEIQLAFFAAPPVAGWMDGWREVTVLQIVAMCVMMSLEERKLARRVKFVANVHMKKDKEKAYL
jgi:hypothetical protein